MWRRLLCALGFHNDADLKFVVGDGRTVMRTACTECEWVSPGIVIPSRSTS
jgi:hypothetical protein